MDGSSVRDFFFFFVPSIPEMNKGIGVIKQHKRLTPSIFTIDTENHALNPSVVTYEHDTRRL